MRCRLSCIVSLLVAFAVCLAFGQVYAQVSYVPPDRTPLMEDAETGALLPQSSVENPSSTARVPSIRGNWRGQRSMRPTF